MIEEAIGFLLDAQNRDGGWGAGKGRGSNTEATALALLALESVKSDCTVGNVQKGTTWLIERQKPDGSWPWTADTSTSSWITALAVIALGNFDAYRDVAVKGARWLRGQEGSGLPLITSLLVRFSIRKMVVKVNPDLKGWAWTPGTFSWVEPTSYSLIALKKLRPHLDGNDVKERIQQGELMIYDRMCEGGGWNYGNSKVLGESLWPYPDVTALALIALQDHSENEANRLSLGALQKMLKQVNSGLALSWSVICFSLYGYDIAEWTNLLAKSFDRTKFLGETKSIALSILALGDGARFFRL